MAYKITQSENKLPEFNSGLPPVLYATSAASLFGDGTMIRRVCCICEKEFWVYPSAIKRGRSKCCSLKCANQSISQSLKGRIRPAEIGRKISNTKIKMGYIASESTRKKISKNRKGKCMGLDNCNWKGGRIKDTEGYIFVLNRNHPFARKSGYILEHRLVLEKHLGRYLQPEEIIHHINEIVDDNRIGNLRLFPTKSAHTKFHQTKVQDG